MTRLEDVQIGRKSTFTAVQKCDAVMGVISKRKTVAETCRELGNSETTFARWREQALGDMAAALADKGSRDSGGPAREAARGSQADDRPAGIGERSAGERIATVDVSVRVTAAARSSPTIASWSRPRRGRRACLGRRSTTGWHRRSSPTTS